MFGTLHDRNSSAQPTYEAHQNFIISLRVQPCSNVHAVHVDERCIFVTETEECRDSMHYFDYMDLMYCRIDSSNRVLFGLAVAFLLLVVVVLAAIVRGLSIHRYVDSVLLVSKTLHLNEYLAGVTILTFANCLPEVLHEIKPNQPYDTEPIYNQYLGTALFEVAFTGPLVIIIEQFYVYPDFFMPNIITLLAVSVLVEVFMYDEQVDILKTVVLFAIYLLYLVVIAAVCSRHKYKLDEERSIISIRRSDGSLVDVLAAEQLEQPADSIGSFGEQFWAAAAVFGREQFMNASILRKLVLLVQAAVEMPLVLLIPKVGYHHPLHGWSRWLFVINLNLFPLLLYFTSSINDLAPHDITYGSTICFLSSTILSAITFAMTRQNKVPSFFIFVALFSMFGTIYVAMLLTYEMVAILETLSIIANISRASFGITILSWGTSWIDLNTLTTLAKRGYPRLAFAASLGGPLFNILIGLGTVFIVRMVQSKATSIFVRDGASGPTCAIFLMMATLTILLSLLLCHFQTRLSLACCLLVLYCTFLAYIALCELEVTHGYGTDHNDDGEYFHDLITMLRSKTNLNTAGN